MARIKEVDLSCGHKNCPIAYVHDSGEIYVGDVRFSNNQDVVHNAVMLSKPQLKKLYNSVFGDK